MIRHRHIDLICGGAILLALVLTGLLCFGEALGLRPASAAPGYASRLFDDGRVHTVDLRVEDWAAFLENAPAEEYIPCTAVIDGEEFYQVGLRAKGNNSLRLTEEYGLSRYSLKLEFDHYVDGGNYHGLDKFSLDASFQDNSYLKTWLVYHMMAYMEVPAPLCSYAWVTVNGQPWGLFLAIEEPEEAFARRNFGPNHGQLYKPDYRSLNAENADVALRYTGDDPAGYPNIFDWLSLLDVNVWIILLLMVCVAGVTMVSGLLILILERTSTIGLLKAMGATNAMVRHTFIHLSVFIIVRGLIWGNVIGLGLVGVQAAFGIVKLDPANYYVESVPVLLNGWLILGLNAGALLVTTLALVGPSFLISRIQPAKAIRFD